MMFYRNLMLLGLVVLFNITNAQCTADAGTVTVTVDGVAYPGGSDIILCWDQSLDNCIDINSNNDFVLPPDAIDPIFDPAELMYGIYYCPATPGVEPDLDPCFTGLFWTGQDFSNCNTAADNLPDIIASITGVYDQDYYLYPVTMDDGDNETFPFGNGVLNYDQNLDGCYDIGLDQYVNIIYLNPLGAVATPICANGTVNISVGGCYPEMFAADYTAVNNGSGTLNTSAITSTGLGDSVTFSITGLNDGDTWSVTFGGSYDCEEVTLTGTFVACVCNTDVGTFAVNGTTPVNNTYFICNNVGDAFDIISNNDFTLPPTPDIAGVAYAIYDCPPTSADIDNDPCWTGLYWTGQDIPINDGLFDYFGLNELWIVPITMDDFQTTTGSGSDDNLGHDIDGDGCFDLLWDNPFHVVRLTDIAASGVEDCANGSVDVTITGGLPESEGTNYTINNVLPASASLTGGPISHNGTITLTGLADGDNYSFDVVDGNGCTYSFSGGPYAACACNADVGTVNVTMDGIDVTDVSNVYNVCADATIELTATGYTLQSGASPNYDFAVLSCPLTVTDPLQDPCYIGSDLGDVSTTLNDNTYQGQTFYIVPVTIDNDGNTTAADFNNDGCYAVGNQIIINFLNPINVVTTENCNDSTVNIEVTGGQAELDGSIYSFNNIQPTHVSLTGTPITHGGAVMLNDLNSGDNYSLDVSDANGCTFNVTGGPFYMNAVEGGMDQSVCDGASATLTASNYDGTVSWDNGVTDGTPFTPATTTTYIVTANNGGCMAYDTVEVSVGTTPTLDAGVGQSICASDPVTLTAGNPDGAVISWDNGVTDGVAFTVNTTTTYTLTGDLNGCPGAPSQVTITVNETPSFTIDNVLNPSCDNNDGTFTINITGTPTFEIYVDGVSYLTGASNSELISGLSDGSYSVYVTNGNCDAAPQNVSLVLPQSPSGTLDITDENCTAQNGVIVVNMNQGATPYQYSIDGNPAAGSNTFPNLSAGNYVVTVTDDNNCTVQLNGTVGTINNTSALFDMSTYEGEAPLDVSFVNNSTDADSYIWNFDNGNTSNLENPANQIFNEGTYNVSLWVSNAFGCMDSMSLTLFVYPGFEIEIPNVFTPNGDGENDIFYVTGSGIEEINCVIFNRWGNKVVEFDPVLNGWNGKNYNGADLNDEVYFYYITVKDAKGENHEFNGNVTLMR